MLKLIVSSLAISLMAVIAVSSGAQPQTATVAAPLPSPSACTSVAHPEYRQLDFWIGDWIVFKGEQKLADVHVEKVLSECALSETWKGVRGDGLGLSTFNQKTKEWEYFWVSDKGATSHFSGTLLPGEMRYRLQVPLPDGGVRMRHWSLIQLPDGKVRELSVGSNDDGANWTTEYDYVWVKKN
jgi:hypothetical protein